MYLLQVCPVCFHICSPNIINKVNSLVLQVIHWCPPVCTMVCWSLDDPHSHSIPHENIFGRHIAKIIIIINTQYECSLI